jgi:cephalosporin hydroxylase
MTAEAIRKAYEFGMVQIESEIAALVKLVEELRPHNMLEIGSEAGGTFYLWTRILPIGGLKISLDLPTGTSGSGRFAEPNALAQRTTRLKSWSANVHVVTGDSHEQRSWDTVDAILNRGREKLDFLFLDGDHSYEGVKLDWEDYRKFVRPGGLVAFHDIVDSEFHRKRGCFVSRLWREIEGEKHAFTAGQEWGGIGVVRV